MLSFNRGGRTPVAALIVIYPPIEFKSVKSDALGPNRNFGEMRTYFVVETVTVHPKIHWRITES
jgi:hypothetical protein